MAGLFQLPSLTRMLVCEARTKRMRVVENSVSFLFRLKLSCAVILVRSLRLQCFLKNSGSSKLTLSFGLSRPCAIIDSCALSSANFSWVKCVRILSRYYPNLRRCSERFPNIYWKFPKMFRRSPNVAEDVQRLLKVSKAATVRFGHSTCCLAKE